MILRDFSIPDVTAVSRSLSMMLSMPMLSSTGSTNRLAMLSMLTVAVGVEEPGSVPCVGSPMKLDRNLSSVVLPTPLVPVRASSIPPF